MRRKQLRPTPTADVKATTRDTARHGTQTYTCNLRPRTNFSRLLLAPGAVDVVSTGNSRRDSRNRANRPLAKEREGIFLEVKLPYWGVPGFAGEIQREGRTDRRRIGGVRRAIAPCYFSCFPVLGSSGRPRGGRAEVGAHLFFWFSIFWFSRKWSLGLGYGTREAAGGAPAVSLATVPGAPVGLVRRLPRQLPASPLAPLPLFRPSHAETPAALQVLRNFSPPFRRHHSPTRRIIHCHQLYPGTRPHLRILRSSPRVSSRGDGPR